MSAYAFGPDALSPAQQAAYMAQAAWYVDGSNVTTKASDSNDGKTAATPLLTYGEWERRTGGGASVPMAVYKLSSSLIGDPFLPAASRPILSGACIMLNGEQGLTALYSSAGATAIQQGQPSFIITAATTATPIVCTFAATNYAPQTGDVVEISGALGQTVMNGTWKIVRVDSTHFSLTGSVGSGTYTASSATALWPNVPWTLTDSALPGTWLNSGPGSTTLIAYRIRWPSLVDAHGNQAIALTARDLGSKTVRISQPIYNFATLPSVSVPAPTGVTKVIPTTGVPYVVEAMPTMADFVPALAVSGDSFDGLQVKVMYVGVAVAGGENSPVNGNVGTVVAGSQAAVKWFGCDTANVGGTAIWFGCLSANFSSAQQGQGYWIACAIMGDFVVPTGCSASFAGGTIVQCTNIFGGGGGLTVGPGGSIQNGDASSFGVFDSTGPGIVISYGGIAGIDHVWGSGNATYGVQVQGPGGNLAWTNAATIPTITGATNDCLVGGDAKTWVALAAGGHSAANGAGAWPLL